MKKILLSVAVLAAFASCSKNEVVDTVQTTEIGFTTLNDRVVSKAANDGDASYQIYAAKSDATDETVWYINSYVDCGDSADATAPNGGPYYWPTDNTKLSFYAYAPYGCSNIASATATTASIPLTYTVPTTADEDFTVATPVTGLTSASNGVTDGAIALSFQHMLAKVSVVVKLDDATDGSLANYEISTSDGDSDFTASFTPLINKFKVDAINGTAAVAGDTDNALVGSDVVYSGKTSYMIAPQAFSGCKLQIKGISVRKKDDGTSFFPSTSADLTEITLNGTELNGTGATFVAGTHYTFTITISSTSTEQGQTTPAVEIKATATTTGWAESAVSVDTDTES